MKKNYINTKTGVLKSSMKDFYRNLAFFLMAFALLFSGLNSEAQTVNKQLYLKTGALLNRTVPISGTIQSTTPLLKQTAIISGTPAFAKSFPPGGGNISPLTISNYVTPTGSNRLMIVTIVSDPENVLPPNNSVVTSVTYGGVALTKLDETVNASNVKVELWYLKSPAVTTANVVINWTPTTALQLIAGVTTLNDTDPDATFGTVAKATGSAANSSINVESAVGDFIFDAIGDVKAGMTAGSGQTVIFNETSNKISASSSRKVGVAGSTSMAWTFASCPFAHMGVAIKGQSNNVTFTQSPVLCAPFTIKAGQTITVIAHAAVTLGTVTGTPIPFVVKLIDGATTIFTASSAANSGLGSTPSSGTLTWTGTIAADYTILAGGALLAEFYSDYTSANIRIDYDASTKISYIQLPTSTYVNINSLAVYNAAYPGGSIITQQAVGVTNYLRAVVSDPFGFADISGMDISITGAATSSGTATSVATLGCTRTYEYAWTPTVGGSYTLQATAKEGTEGTVTHVSSTGFTGVQPSLTVTKTKVSPVSGPFTMNDNIVYNIAIHNTGLSSLTLLPLQDTYSTSCLQYIGSSITPTNISGGVITWNNIGTLATGSTVSVTLTMKVVGNCNPVTNTATVTGAKDGLNYVATTQASSFDINIDQPPVAVADNYCIQASTPLPVLGNDTDPDVVGFLSANTGLYNVSISTPPANGSVTVNGDKTIQFNPAGGTPMSENNTVTFVYRVTEIANPAYFSEATVTVLFSAVNSAPSAVSDIASTSTGKPVVINVLANDSDPDGILQTPTVTVQPLYGTVLVNADKTITYSPFAGFEGTDGFTYQVCDDGCPTPVLCATATATISVVFAQYVCQEGINTLSVSPISDAVSYTWTLPAGATVSGTYSGSLPNPTTTSPTITVNWSGVTAGTYSICALASNECGPGANQCTQLVVNKVLLSFIPTQIGCYGSSTGAINLTVSGGIAPYTYAWTRSGGGYSASIEDISHLLPGTYNVTVTDNFGCTATGSSTISQPASPISISVNTITNENPYGSSNGAIDISVSGGTPGYTYSWSNGSTTEDISGLTGGTYSVTVTDLNGCTANQIFTVDRIGGPLAVSFITKTDVLCNGGNTGSVNLEVVGGTSPYTYNWTKTGVVNPPPYSTNQDLSNIPAGTYSVLITDAATATTTASITVNQPVTALSASNTHINVSCNGAGNGSIDVTVTGGTAPYTYLWNNGATTEDLSGIPAGAYSVTVTDKNGCLASTSATITQPTALLLSGTVINSNCNPGSNGAINISVSGGSGPYTFLWSNGATTQNVSGLPPGDYSVTATDGSGCKVSRAFSVGNSCLGAAKTISGTPVNNGNGTYSLTYIIKVQNTGTVTLNNVQVTENLATTFTGAISFAVNSISSGDFTVNNSFNGNGNNNLLTSPLGSLLPGDPGFITLVLNVTPGTKLGIYNNNATASATDPNGLNISDVSQDGANVDPDSNGNPGDNSDPTPVTFTEHPLIGVAKELASGPTINTDGSYNLSFTIRVRNYGDVPLKNVQVTDNLLSTFGVSSTITVLSITSADMDENTTYNGTTITSLLLGTDVMTVNEVNTIQLSIKVTPSGAGPFNNTAVGTGYGPGETLTTDQSQNGVNPDPDNNGNPTDNDVPTPITFAENPEIGSAKLLAGLPVNNHDGTYSLTYEIRVKNTGNVNLHNVQVTDDLSTTFPGKTVEVTSISSSYFAVNNSYNGTNNLLAGTDILTVGAQYTITLTIKVTPGTNLGTYNNNATASGLSIFNTSVNDVSNNGTDVDPENDGPGNNSVPTPVNFTETPILGVAKAVSVPVNNHDGTYTITYTIKVQNLGDVPVNNVQVTDNLGATFTGSTSFTVIGVPSSSLPVNGSYNGTSNINLLSGTNTLAYGTSATITVSVLVTPGSKLGVYNNSATGTATSAGGTTLTDVSTNGTDVDPDNDGNPGNNSVPTPVSFNEDPHIFISKSLISGPTPSGGNYALTYRLTVENTGDVPLNNVQVVEDLLSTFPSPASIVSATATSTVFTINGSFNGTTNSNLLSGGQTLLYGTTKTIDVTVTVNPGGVGGPYVNEAFAYGQSPSGRFVNDVSNAVIVTFFEHPKIGIAKNLESNIDNLDGTNTVTFLLTIENFGDVELKDLEIYDDIITQFASVSPTTFFASGGTLFASGTWDGSGTSNILTPGQTLGVGQTATVIISFKVTPGTLCSLDNVASAKGTSPTLVIVSEDISTNGTDPDGSTIDDDPVEQVPTPVPFIDNDAPVITCPADITVAAGTGCTASGVALGTPTTNDNCTVSGTTNDAPSVFPIGVTTVTWTVTDGSGNSATCSQNVTVTNSAPIAVGDTYTITRSLNGSATLSANVLINDHDPEGQVLTVTNWGTPSSGSLTATNSNGLFTYTAVPGYIEENVTFTYTVSDTCGLESIATAAIHILCQAPATPGPVQKNN